MYIESQEQLERVDRWDAFNKDIMINIIEPFIFNDIEINNGVYSRDIYNTCIWSIEVYRSCGYFLIGPGIEYEQRKKVDDACRRYREKFEEISDCYECRTPCTTICFDCSVVNKEKVV